MPEKWLSGRPANSWPVPVPSKRRAAALDKRRCRVPVCVQWKIVAVAVLIKSKVQ